MGFPNLVKSSCGWSPLLVQHEKIEKKLKVFGLDSIHLLFFIALVEGTTDLY